MLLSRGGSHASRPKQAGSSLRNIPALLGLLSCVAITYIVFHVASIIDSAPAAAEAIVPWQRTGKLRIPARRQQRFTSDDDGIATSWKAKINDDVFKKLLDVIQDPADAALRASILRKAKGMTHSHVVEPTFLPLTAEELSEEQRLMNKTEAIPHTRRLRAFWFTMDSLQSYVENAARGGPSGEIAVRKSLVAALNTLDVDVDVAASDAEFAQMTSTDVDRYDFFFFDPWTYVGPGWIVRPFIRGREERTFIVSFFGMRNFADNLALPLSHVLSPYPSVPGNTFIGLIVDPKWSPRTSLSVHFDGRAQLDPSKHKSHDTKHGGHTHDGHSGAEGNATLPIIPKKKNMGVLWGKVADYFQNKERLLREVAKLAQIHTIANIGYMNIPNLVVHGHLDSSAWNTLLAESKFLLGVGDPLSGPSALDAVAAGCVFINPTFAVPKQEVFMSQHPYLAKHVGKPYVCNYAEGDAAGARACVEEALAHQEDLQPFVPPDMTREAYLQRIRDIFQPHINSRLVANP